MASFFNPGGKTFAANLENNKSKLETEEGIRFKTLKYESLKFLDEKKNGEETIHEDF